MEAVFWPGVASYRDPLGTTVHQLTTTDASGADNQTPYWHQNLAVDDDRILIVNLDKAGAEYTVVNVRTGARSLAAARGTANGEFVRNGAMYGFHYAESKAWLGRLDLDTLVWEHFVLRSPSSTFKGGVAVNIAENRIIWLERDGGEQRGVRVRAFDRERRQMSTLYDGPDDLQHMVFSPVDPDLFFYINQSAGLSIRRLGLGRVEARRMQPISAAGDYWTKRFNLADPFWSHGGGLMSDVIWHPDDPPGSYALVRFDVSRDAGAAFVEIAPAQQTRWLFPVVWRNQHVNPTRFPGWFVGDGDPQGFFSGRRFVSLVYIPPHGGVVRVYPLASHRGPLPHQNAVPNTHALPGGDALVTTWRYDAASGRESTANVYLIEVPRHLRRAMVSGRPPDEQEGIPLQFPERLRQ